MSELPDVIPVFPLPNVVLFPQVQLPLHIFESRYREMVRDIAGTAQPLMGMVLYGGSGKSSTKEIRLFSRLVV